MTFKANFRTHNASLHSLQQTKSKYKIIITIWPTSIESCQRQQKAAKILHLRKYSWCFFFLISISVSRRNDENKFISHEPKGALKPHLVQVFFASSLKCWRESSCHNIHVDAVRFHTCVQRMNLLKYKKSLVVLLRRCDDNQEYLNRNDIAFYSTQEGNKQFTVQYTRH